jgi:ribosome-binding factor A
MPSGFVGILTFELHIPDGESLKGKRRHLLHTKAQLERRFGATVAEVDFHDLWQRSRMTMAVVRREHAETRRALRRRRPVMPGERLRRVNAALREVLAEGIEALEDPGIGFVTVTSVRATPDLGRADVFVSVLGTRRRRERALRGLDRAHGVLQSRIAHELHLKRTPQLSFHYDETVDRAMRLNEILAQAPPPADHDPE